MLSSYFPAKGQRLNFSQLMKPLFSSVPLFHCSSVPLSFCSTVFLLEGGGGVYSPKFCVGVCCTVLKTLTQFQTKIDDFSDPFSDLTPEICTPFQT